MSATPYHLAERGVSVGVLSGSEVEAGLATGRLSATTLSWREGEPGWIALAVRPEFSAAIVAQAAVPVLPGDTAETAVAWTVALQNKTKPTALLLSRQNIS